MLERLRSLRDRLLSRSITTSLKGLAALVEASEPGPYTKPRDLEFKAEGTFTGVCQVREYTADGHAVGRCLFGTKDGICPRHGDVMTFVASDKWPRDFELPKYDGQAWAERLRREIHDRNTK